MTGIVDDLEPSDLVAEPYPCGADTNSSKTEIISPSKKNLEASLRLKARQIHDAQIAYIIYGALNGFNDSYMLVKYFFDVSTPKGIYSSDAMHEWMITPGGTAAIAMETVAFIGFSLIANCCDEDSANSFKRYIAVAYPYFRESLKGLRYSYKGVRSALQIPQFFSGVDLKYMIIPLAIGIGVLSAFNRMWHRRMYKQRKVFMKENIKLLEIIQCTDLKDVNHDWSTDNLKKVNEKFHQSECLRKKAFVSVGFGAVVDSLYQFMGLVAISALCPQLYIAMTIFCVLYAAVNIATRLYEEHDYQRKLIESQTKVKLAICAKELELLHDNLNLCAPDDETENIKLFNEKLVGYNKIRAELYDLVTFSDRSSVFIGLKAGLMAYSVITSIIFAVATFSAMAMVAFPPALLVAGIVSGVFFLGFFVAYAVVENRKERENLEKTKHDHDLHLKKYNNIRAIDTPKKGDSYCPYEMKDKIQDGQVIHSTDLVAKADWFEVPRQVASGTTKASKTVDLLLNSQQELDSKGHYQDSPLMLILTVFTSAIYAISYGFRTFARVGRSSPSEGYSFELRSKIDHINNNHDPDDTNKLEKDKMYLACDDKNITYECLDPKGERRTGIIDLEYFKTPDNKNISNMFNAEDNPTEKLAKLNKLRRPILDFIAKKGEIPLRYNIQATGYEVCAMSELEDLPKYGKLYLEFKDGQVYYRLKDANNNDRNGAIDVTALHKKDKSTFKNFQGSLKEFSEARNSILTIISDKGHLPLRNKSSLPSFFARSRGAFGTIESFDVASTPV